MCLNCMASSPLSRFLDLERYLAQVCMPDVHVMGRQGSAEQPFLSEIIGTMANKGNLKANAKASLTNGIVAVGVEYVKYGSRILDDGTEIWGHEFTLERAESGGVFAFYAQQLMKSVTQHGLAEVEGGMLRRRRGGDGGDAEEENALDEGQDGSEEEEDSAEEEEGVAEEEAEEMNAGEGTVGSVVGSAPLALGANTDRTYIAFQGKRAARGPQGGSVTSLTTLTLRTEILRWRNGHQRRTVWRQDPFRLSEIERGRQSVW